MKKYFLLLSLLLLSAAGYAGELRIVSLSPAVTDAIIEIGAAEFLCGRSRVCNAPGTQKIPVAGDMGLPATEKILQLKATHIICDSRHPGGNWKFLEKCGIKTIFLPGKKIADFPANIRYLGKLCNRQSAADAAAGKFEQKISELKRIIPVRRPKVLAVLSVSPVISCGAGSFINEALQIAGAENICRQQKRSYFTLSAEHIIKSAPEYIIIAGVPEMLVTRYFQRPEFRNLPAVKRQNFIAVAPDEFCRSGIRLPEAIRKLQIQLSRKAVSPGPASHSLR